MRSSARIHTVAGSVLSGDARAFSNSGLAPAVRTMSLEEHWWEGTKKFQNLTLHRKQKRPQHLALRRCSRPEGDIYSTIPRAAFGDDVPFN